MKRRLPLLITSSLVIALVLILGMARTSKEESPVATPFKATCEGWNIVQTPDPVGNWFYGVAAISSTDVSAVGVGNSGTLTEHWNGKKWSIVPSPGTDEFLAVAAVSTNDVWAVGFSMYLQGGINRTYVAHWNGKKWLHVSSPNPGPYENVLYGVTAISTNDVWAVGDYDGGTLTEHWDGRSWSVIPSPDPGGNSAANRLYAVASDASNDVWAVGSYYSGHVSYPITLHWNGKQWRTVSNPFVGYRLNGVTAISSNDAWAAGYEPTMTLHWNGKKWSQIPDSSPINSTLLAITRIPGTNRLWLVGETGSGQPLSELWNGKRWLFVPTPPTSGTSSLNAVAALDAHHVWAVGYSFPSSKALVEFYC